MNDISIALFNSEKWKCPVSDCNTVLAEIKTDANKTPFLLLPRGFVFVQARRLYLRPKNTLSYGQGTQMKTQRRLQKQILADDDGRFKSLMQEAEKAPVPRPILDADQINDEPLLLLCPNENCKRVCHIPALRGHGDANS